MIFAQQPNMHLHDDGGIYRLRTRLVKTLDEQEAEVWRARLEQNFPKIMHEDLSNVGADGVIVWGEYVRDGKYDRVNVWCPDTVHNPIFIEMIAWMLEPFGGEAEAIRISLN